ncbi:hypothetical protein CIB48_g667 [Xylaria polymorpha]|nr:hypothetical protein CIB48_g667 [Xylaria polymorpha]
MPYKNRGFRSVPYYKDPEVQVELHNGHRDLLRGKLDAPGGASRPRGPPPICRKSPPEERRIDGSESFKALRVTIICISKSFAPIKQPLEVSTLVNAPEAIDSIAHGPGEERLKRTIGSTSDTLPEIIKAVKGVTIMQGLYFFVRKFSVHRTAQGRVYETVKLVKCGHTETSRAISAHLLDDIGYISHRFYIVHGHIAHAA